MPIELLSQMYLKIDGKDVSAEIMRDLKELVVDTSLHLPDMFTIHLNDPAMIWVDDSLFDVGNIVVVSGKEPGDSSETNLITAGEITALEPEMTEIGATTVLFRGYDKMHRLHRGKKTRTFLQYSDADIVRKLASEAGINTGVIDATNEVYDHVFQDYQTDWEFLQDRARRNGYYLYVKDGKLYFCKEPSGGSKTPVLEWGVNLFNFQARFTTSEQVVDAEVHGWDMKKKIAIIGKSDTPRGTPEVNGVTHGGNASKSAFGASREVVNDHPIRTQSEADTLAQSILDDHCHAFFEAEGTCSGNPDVRAGVEVEIKGVGSRFSGRYRITRAVHRYNIEGYVTEFEISGHRANTLSQLLEYPGKNPYGVVVGVVTNVNDPEKLARVKVKFPTISDQLESNWARLSAPMAGNKMGFEFIPEVNDEVLVAFEYDDINKPYILGSLWNGKDLPPETTDKIVTGGKVQKRIIRSRTGHVITLDDSDGKEKITIIDKTGKNSIEIDSTTNSLNIKTEGIINLETKDDVNIKGKNINLEAVANATVKAKSNLNLEATAKATLKGNAGVDVNGGGPTNIKGAVINLN